MDVPDLELPPESRQGNKRIRHACEPCRRKKSKCPGQQPICSLCARLNQICYYGEPPEKHRKKPRHQPSPQQSRSIALSRAEEGSAQISANRVNTVLRKPRSSEVFGKAALPPWSQVIELGRLYLKFVEGQPLPLFHPESFISSLEHRDPALIYAILATSIPFSQDPDHLENKERVSSGYAEVAHSLALGQICDHTVELSTLQTVIILTLFDFNCGNRESFAFHKNLASTLVRTARLDQQIPPNIGQHLAEERTRCYWSTFLLQNLYDGLEPTLDIPQCTQPFPTSAMKPRTSANHPENMNATVSRQEGVLVVVIHLSQAWSRAAAYVRGHGQPGSHPIWHLGSEYARQMSSLMQIGTELLPIHRFKAVNVEQQAPEEMSLDRGYWAPWFLTRFMYHTTICLLNHPLLIMLHLQGHSKIPELCLEQTSFLISHHTNWIINLLSILESKDFHVTDPLIGYCVAVTATIELHMSFSSDPDTREEKSNRYKKCAKFVEDMAEMWPSMARMTEKLVKLATSLSASYQCKLAMRADNVDIDLALFWDILEIPNAAPGTSDSIFGASLQPPNSRQPARGRIARLQVPPSVTPVQLDRPPSFSGVSNPMSADADWGPMDMLMGDLPAQPCDYNTMPATDFFNLESFSLGNAYETSGL